MTYCSLNLPFQLGILHSIPIDKILGSFTKFFIQLIEKPKISIWKITTPITSFTGFYTVADVFNATILPQQHRLMVKVQGFNLLVHEEE